MGGDYVIVELIGGRFGGSVAAVYPHGDQPPAKIDVGGVTYVRFRATSCYFPDEEEGSSEARPPRTPFPLPMLRGRAIIP